MHCTGTAKKPEQSIKHTKGKEKEKMAELKALGISFIFALVLMILTYGMIQDFKTVKKWHCKQPTKQNFLSYPQR